jgi:hypothetical protein
MAAVVADSSDSLARRFRQGYRQLLGIFARRDLGDDPETLRENILAQVADILESLYERALRWIEAEVPQSYQEGQEEALERLRRLGRGDVPDAPGELLEAPHRAAIEALAYNLRDDLRDSLQLVGRRTQDALRQAGLEAARQELPTSRPMSEAQDRLQEIVEERGLSGLVDSAGREWPPDVYAQMAARTTINEAQNLGTLNQLEGLGVDLVYITTHAGECAICAKYSDRVYSASGQDSRYPPLRGTAYSVAYHTIHPNCRHRLVPYIEEFADDPAGDREKSNKPFVDDRPEKVKRAYDEGQNRKRRAREAARRAKENPVVGDGQREETQAPA